MVLPEPPPAATSPRLGVVIAMKDLGRAKTRMHPLPPALRERLAAHMALATAAAWQPLADHIVVVTAAPGLDFLLRANGVAAQVVSDPQRGLNPAFAAGEDAARASECDLIVACMADLPTLTEPALRAAMGRCVASGRWFVRDAEGTGTTLLAARGRPLEPLFGRDSAYRHARSGARELPAEPCLRLDIDEPGDLIEAARLGLPPNVSLFVAEDRLATHGTAVVTGSPPQGGWWLILSDGTRAYAPRETLGAELRGLSPGQRVHVVLTARAPVHLWL